MSKGEQPQEPPAPLTWLGGEWEHSSWLHPAWVAAGTYAAGEAATLGGLSPWYAGGLTVAAGAAGLLATAGSRFCDAARAYMTGAGLAVGAWLTWASATSPFNTPSVIAAVAGTLVATAAYPGMRHAQQLHEQRVRFWAQRGEGPAAVVVDPEPAKPEDARRWEKFMASVGLRGLTYLERTPNKAGFAVRFRLPATGSVTFSHVVNAAHRIEIGFPHGRDGMVRVERARDEHGRDLAGEVLLHFDVRDVLAETITMPMEHTPLSINTAFPIGEFTDGEPIYLTLREIAALIVGLRGRGKTNLFNVLVHQLSRCVDVCLWGIDLKGGRAIKPWLRAWLDGRAKRPVFDWVATSRAEAHLMLKGALGLITQRGEQGSGGTKITPSRRQPAVLILCDEVAALTGQHSGPRFRSDGEGPTARDFSADITLGIQLGRSEAVDWILFTQRSTVSMTGGGDLKSQCELRIGLGVSNPQDARSVFEGDAVAAKLLAKFKGKRTRGSVMVQEGEDRAMPGKCYFYGDDVQMLANVYEASIKHADLPAPLDEAGQRAVDAAVRAASGGQHGYSDRWDTARAAHLYSDDLPPEVTDADIDAMRDEPSGTPQRGGTSTATEPRTEVRRNRFFPARQRRSGPVVEQEPSTAEDPEWDALIAKFEQSGTPVPEPERPGDSDRQARMVDLVDEAGERGTTASRLYAALVDELGDDAPARQTMHTWLNSAKDDGQIKQPSPRGRYYTPRNVR